MWLKSASVRCRFASVVCGFCRSILYGPEPGPKLIALQKKKTKKNYWQLTNLNRFLLLEVTKIQWSSKFSHVVLLTTQSLCHSSCNQQFWLQWHCTTHSVSVLHRVTLKSDRATKQIRVQSKSVSESARFPTSEKNAGIRWIQTLSHV